MLQHDLCHCLVSRVAGMTKITLDPRQPISLSVMFCANHEMLHPYLVKIDARDASFCGDRAHHIRVRIEIAYV